MNLNPKLRSLSFKLINYTIIVAFLSIIGLTYSIFNENSNENKRLLDELRKTQNQNVIQKIKIDDLRELDLNRMYSLDTFFNSKSEFPNFNKLSSAFKILMSMDSLELDSLETKMINFAMKKDAAFNVSASYFLRNNKTKTKSLMLKNQQLLQELETANNNINRISYHINELNNHCSDSLQSNRLKLEYLTQENKNFLQQLTEAKIYYEKVIENLTKLKDDCEDEHRNSKVVENYKRVNCGISSKVSFVCYFPDRIYEIDASNYELNIKQLLYTIGDSIFPLKDKIYKRSLGKTIVAGDTSLVPKLSRRDTIYYTLKNFLLDERNYTITKIVAEYKELYKDPCNHKKRLRYLKVREEIFNQSLLLRNLISSLNLKEQFIKSNEGLIQTFLKDYWILKNKIQKLHV